MAYRFACDGSKQKKGRQLGRLATSRTNCSFVKDATKIEKKKREVNFLQGVVMWFYNREADAIEMLTCLETGAQVIRSGEGDL